MGVNMGIAFGFPVTEKELKSVVAAALTEQHPARRRLEWEPVETLHSPAILGLHVVDYDGFAFDWAMTLNSKNAGNGSGAWKVRGDGNPWKAEASVRDSRGGDSTLSVYGEISAPLQADYDAMMQAARDVATDPGGKSRGRWFYTLNDEHVTPYGVGPWLAPEHRTGAGKPKKPCETRSSPIHGEPMCVTCGDVCVCEICMAPPVRAAKS